MSEYHEPEAELSDATRNLHRALRSLYEELEAVDWYQQRWDACTDDALRAVLAHNRDEEIEHACMTLEWLRRTVPAWDRTLRTYLFSRGPITEIEKRDEAREASEGPAGRSDLGIGSLRRKP